MKRKQPSRLNTHRKVRRGNWSDLNAAHLHAFAALPKDSPRKKPTFPVAREGRAAMSKPSTYRGVQYTVLRSGTIWHAILFLNDVRTDVPERKTKTEVVELVERAIDIAFDYDGDEDLYFLVSHIVRAVKFDRRIRGLNVRQMMAGIDRACEIAKRKIEREFLPSERAALIEKLRAMTAANGCTPAEAAAALAKLQKLEAAP
jgi:hypothetical protein